MSYNCNDPSSYESKKVGSGQCAEFVQACANAPATSSWTKGDKVKGNTTIKPGTAIATFNVHGLYANNSTGNHAAI